jgi:hypothetical protein
MNTEDKIKKCLKSAPKPAAPDGLLNRLQEDVAAGEIKKRVTVIRRWFAPANGSISLWRVAAAAAIAIAVLLPWSYGATKTVKRMIKTFEAKFVYPQDNGSVHGYGAMHGYKVGSAIGSNDPNFTEEDAHKALREFYELYKQGKAKEVTPGVWVATLSNGHGFGYGGDPEMLGFLEAERKNFLKKQFDEIHELRKAGKFERTFIKEVEKNGVKIRFYEDRFTLSNGKVITMGAGVGGNIDLELLDLSEAERKEALKKQFDEINELRKAGKFERTFKKEMEIDGVMRRLYEDSFILSDGKVIKMGAVEPVKNDNKD